MIDSQRRTGRSQRAVVRALMGAVMGKKVLHVTNSHQHGKDLYQYACKFIEDNGLNEHKQVQFMGHVIHIGCGSVYFHMGGSMNTAGLRIGLIVEDHYVTECSARAAKRKADITSIAALMREHNWHSVNDTRFPNTGSTLLIKE